MTARADSLETILDLISARTVRLDPRAFFAELERQIRGSLPARSMSDGSRSAEKPMPKLDAHDLQMLAIGGAYGRLLFEAATPENLRKLEAIERRVRGVMGFDVHDPDPEKAAAAMRDAQERASLELADEHSGEYRFQCIVCKKVYKRSKSQRPRAGRCRDCFDYWVLTGRLEDRPGDPSEGRCITCSGPLTEDGNRIECPRCRVHRHRYKLPYPFRAGTVAPRCDAAGSAGA